MRDLARRNLDVVRQTFDLGRATVFDVLAEQKRWLEIEQGYTAAAREAWEARVAVTRAQRRDEMSVESRVSLAWPILLGAALLLVALGAGGTYVGLRSVGPSAL